MPLEIVRNDITHMQVDAIVNAANSSLLGGGGVDGAIHRAAGPRLTKACQALGGCETGSAKITRGYDLPCRYVIHTVGPVWRDGQHGEKDLLASCYQTSLELAKAYRCKTVAFPLISTGVYGYPKSQALRVAIDTISDFLLNNDMTVIVVIFDKQSLEISESLFFDISQYIDDVYVDAHTDTSVRQMQRRPLMDLYEQSDYYVGAPKAAPRDSAPRDLFDAVHQLDESFAQMLFRKIDQSGMTDVQCYKKANIDRKLFSKIKSNPGYQPSKPTVLAFAIALRLDLEEAQELLKKAGFALSHSSKFDIIVEYCILHHVYDVNQVNEALFQFDQSLLGNF